MTRVRFVRVCGRDGIHCAHRDAPPDRSLPAFDVKTEKEGDVNYWPMVIIFPAKAKDDLGRNGLRDIIFRLRAAGMLLRPTQCPCPSLTLSTRWCLRCHNARAEDVPVLQCRQGGHRGEDQCHTGSPGGGGQSRGLQHAFAR